MQRYEKYLAFKGNYFQKWVNSLYIWHIFTIFFPCLVKKLLFCTRFEYKHKTFINNEGLS